MEEVGTIDVVDELVSFAWSIDWSICNTKKTGEYILSPTFSTLSDDDKVREWNLQLYPNGASRKFHGSLSIYLHGLEEKKRGFLQKVVNFHLLNNRNEEVNKIAGALYPQFKQDVCGLDQLIPRDLLERNLSELLSAGKLIVVCTIVDTRTEQKFDSARIDGVLQPPKPLPRIHSIGDLTDNNVEGRAARDPPVDHFEAMLESGKSDVCIIVGNKSFYVHRAVLTARNSYFQNNFEQDIVQRKQVSFVDMSEFPADDVVEIMRYLYLDTVDKLEERACSLLALANKYKMEKLKTQCEEVMIKDLNLGNASEYLVLSFLHDASTLQEHAMDFVVGHSLNVVDTPGFKAIAGTHSNVIAAVLKTITLKASKK